MSVLWLCVHCSHFRTLQYLMHKKILGKFCASLLNILSTFLSFFFFPCFRPFLLFSSFSLSLYLVFIFFRRRKKIFFFFWRSFNFCFKSICQSQFRVRLFSVCPQRDVPKLLKRSSFFLSF